MDEAVEGWISPVGALLIDAGIDEDGAEGLARLGLAVTRGLLLDLLATGDTAGTTRAFELFTQLLDLPSGHDLGYGWSGAATVLPSHVMAGRAERPPNLSSLRSR